MKGDTIELAVALGDVMEEARTLTKQPASGCDEEPEAVALEQKQPESILPKPGCQEPIFDGADPRDKRAWEREADPQPRRAITWLEYRYEIIDELESEEM